MKITIWCEDIDDFLAYQDLIDTRIRQGYSKGAFGSDLQWEVQE